MKSCIKDKINVSYNDPYIKSIKLQNKIFKSTSPNRKEKHWSSNTTTDHDIYNFKTIYKKFNKIIDTRESIMFINDKLIHVKINQLYLYL